jgi:hypothetical protein
MQVPCPQKRGTKDDILADRIEVVRAHFTMQLSTTKPLETKTGNLNRTAMGLPSSARSARTLWLEL